MADNGVFLFSLASRMNGFMVYGSTLIAASMTFRGD